VHPDEPVHATEAREAPVDAPAGSETCGAVQAVPKPLTRSGTGLPGDDESIYDPTATHEVADAHRTETRLTDEAEAPAGSGALTAFQNDPEPVSSTPWVLPDESVYEPMAAHTEAEKQETSVMSVKGSAGAPLGTGACFAVQVDPDFATSSPWYPADPV
jgi:hypothetical protein